MADNNTALDAIVITWNRWELTEACLEHIFASSVSAHVIVVDNASSDGTPEKIRERYPRVELHQFDENRGYGAGVNEAFRHATAEFVATVNSDALLEPDYFELVLARMQDERVGFAAGISIDPSTNLVDAAGAIFDTGLRWSQYKNGAEPDGIEIEHELLAAPPFEAMIFRREAFDGVGGFDEEIFAYAEDQDLTLRLRAADWKFAVVPEARDLHKGAASHGKRTAAQMKLVGWGRGYIAGRYRLGPASLLLDLLTWTAISAIVRSPAPLRELVSGWRRGRALPSRERPKGLHTESAFASLKKRWQASRD